MADLQLHPVAHTGVKALKLKPAIIRTWLDLRSIMEIKRDWSAA